MNVVRPDGLITTIYGLRDPALFVKKEGEIDNENEFTTWVEYWDGETLVHRSAHVTVKKLPEFAQTIAGGF